jgi:hypothetical protein
MLLIASPAALSFTNSLVTKVEQNKNQKTFKGKLTGMDRVKVNNYTRDCSSLPSIKLE